MHEQNHKFPSQKSNPCLQIMFNINSKNCVSNNIIANVERDLQIDMSHYDPLKNDKTVIFSNKKHSNQCHTKSNKNTPNKSHTSHLKPTDFISQQNLKSNRKNIQTIKSSISPNTTLKSTKHSNLQKNISGTFTKTNLNQDFYLISEKKTKRTKSSLHANKQMRQKIIELMIKDYEKGKISANNLKVAISSLIEKQTLELKLNPKGHSKTQKSRVQLPNSYKSSLVNTPRNIPAKSKSEKIYQHPLMKCTNKFKKLDEQPQIIERVISRKDFASKIIIKGINSSLFLSNQWTTSDSPQKERTVDVNVINTSDSVKDLRKEMQKVSFKNIVCNQDTNDKKIQECIDRKNNSKTQQILNFYLSKFESHVENQNSEIFEHFYNEKQFTDVQRFQHSLSYEQDKGDSRQLQSQSLEKFEFIQGQSIESKLKMQQSQIQAFYIDQDSVIIQKSSENEKVMQQSVEIQQKIKSYLSSDLKGEDKKLAFSEIKRQELTEKRVKSITENQIKRLNQVMDMITQQVNFKSNQTQNNLSSQTLLSNIALLIQRQRNKASQQLKLYNTFKDKKPTVSQNNKRQNGEKIDQNQIINSFKSKLTKKLNNFGIKNLQQQVLLSQNSQISLSSNHLQKTKISQLNLDEIQTGLYKRLHQIEFKRDQELSVITEKFINDKISAKQYHEDKQIIQKWFQVESTKLKKTKQNLIQGYKKAKDYLLKDEISYETKLTRQKSNKMIQSISEKYLAKKKVFMREDKEISQGELNHIQFKEYKQLISIDSEVQEGQRRMIEQRQYVVDSDRSCLSGLDEENKEIDSYPVSSQYVFNHESGSQGDIKDNGQNTVLDGYIDDEQQMQKVRLIHSSTDQLSHQHEGYYQDELTPNSLQSQNDDNQIELQTENNLQQVDSQSLLHIQEPQQLNIVINKRSTPSSNEYLFSPKKSKHHEQFYQQLQQYSLLNQNEEQSTLSFQRVKSNFNSALLKFKYLTQQDKDDIFQFIFLDLSLQILLDERKNSPIMKTIQKYLALLRKKKTQTKGFKTGLQNCKIYINHMKTYLETNFFSTLKRLQTPIGPSAREMLKFMREYDEVQSQISQSQVQILILPIEVYQRFELQPVNALEVERYFDDQERQVSRIKFLINLKRFHTKALFDSLNEMLDLQRNFGLWGKPFPWKKTLSIDRKLTNSQLKQKLRRSSQKVIENCSYLCGVMLDKEESVFGKVRVSEEYLEHIREDRMSKMLSNEMVDNEVRWTFYDDEEVEVFVQISKNIMSKLLHQVTLEIRSIQSTTMQ